MEKVIEVFQDKKLKIILISLIVILLLILLIGSISKKETKETPSEPTAPENITINEELKNSLRRKINLLKSSNYCEIAVAGNEYLYDCLYRKDTTTKEELTEKYRVYSLVIAMDSLLETKNNYIVGRITVDNITFTNTQTFNYDNIKSEYEKVYGVNPNLSLVQVNSINNFPYVKYDETRNKIFYQTTGVKAEINNNQIAEYINKYESDANNVYVYVSIGYITEIGPQTYGIYTDKNKTIEIGKTTFSQYDRTKIINDSNYQQLPVYKYTFTKEETTNELIFNKVELVK